MQQVEELAAIGARVDITAVGQQLHASAAAGHVEQPRVETPLENFQNLMQLVNAEAASTKIGKRPFCGGRP